MYQAVRHYGSVILGMVAGGVLCGWAGHFMLSPRGAIGPAILQSQALLGAIFALVAVMTVSTGIAVLVARVTNTVVGLFVLGAALAGLGYRLAPVQEIILGGGSLAALALETLLLAALTLVAVVAVFRLAGPLPDVHPRRTDKRAEPWFGSQAFLAASAGAVVLPIVWLIARSPLEGQVLWAVLLGAMAAGLAGRMLCPNAQPVLLFVSPIVFGAAGHLAAVLMMRGSAEAAFLDGSLSPLLLPMPVHYVAGSLMGVAVGLGWARSIMYHDI